MATRRLWVPILVALLVATLIGPGLTAGAEPRAVVTAAVAIPAGAAVPYSDDMDYYNHGDWAYLPSGSGTFVVPLSFPAQMVTIRRVTAYVADGDAGYDVTMTLARTNPLLETTQTLATVSTTGSSPEDPQTITTTEIAPRTVNTANYSLCLKIAMGGNTRLYGLKIVYSYEV